MKVFIHDKEDGELLLAGELSPDQIREMLQVSSLEVYLDGYVPTLPIVEDYKRSDISWLFDNQLNFWLRIYQGQLCATYQVVQFEDVPLPAQMVLQAELLYQENHEIA
ncbi:MAG: hypothetical protein ABSE06_01390 [Anaerolineaceae bacterium]|jgi:hypothetical protein